MATVVAGHSLRRVMTFVDARASGVRTNGMNGHTFLHSPYGLYDVLAQPHWERTHFGDTPCDVTHPLSQLVHFRIGRHWQATKSALAFRTARIRLLERDYGEQPETL